MSEASDRGAAVIPLGGTMVGGAGGEPVAQPLELLADGTGMLLTWEPWSEQSQRWGAPLGAASGLARQLTTVVERAGGLLSKSGETLFRVELPAGRTLSDLVPAVGGGFRNFFRNADGRSIAGHGRLIPVTGGAVGTSAVVALGPLLGLMAISVGADMLARRQQEAKLEAIEKALKRLENHELQLLRAGLDSAEQALDDARWALLDRIVIPEAVGLGPAVAGLKHTKNQALGWLKAWEHIADDAAAKKSGIDFGKLTTALGKVAVGGFGAFGVHIQLAYRAIALDSRAQVVAFAEATISNPDATVKGFHHNVQRRLEQNADELERLCTVLWQLARLEIRGGAAMPGNWNRAAEVQRRLVNVAHAVAELPAALPMLTTENRLTIEAVRAKDGSVSFLEPRLKSVA
jgi:hypothetical protein